MEKHSKYKGFQVFLWSESAQNMTENLHKALNNGKPLNGSVRLCKRFRVVFRELYTFC